MRALSAAVTTFSIALLLIAVPASAFEGGGRKPSEAPLIVPGQHYTGQLNNHKSDANYEGSREVALWRLPPLATHDMFTVSWHQLPRVGENSDFPICMTFAENVNDYSWGGVFGHQAPEWEGCSSNGPLYSVSGSGTAETQMSVGEASAASSYLEFFAWANETNSQKFETYPYDFTVIGPLHYLGLATRQVKRVSASGVITATVNLATGSPAPDGLTFNLAVTWPGGGVAGYTGTSSGGTVKFQLALPETAYGKSATFEVSHPADATYQAVTASKLVALVAKPKVTSVKSTSCEKVRRHAHVLARRHRKLVRNLRRAHGVTRARLRRQASRISRKLRAARTQAGRACAT